MLYHHHLYAPRVVPADPPGPELRERTPGSYSGHQRSADRGRYSAVAQLVSVHQALLGRSGNKACVGAERARIFGRIFGSVREDLRVYFTEAHG